MVYGMSIQKPNQLGKLKGSVAYGISWKQNREKEGIAHSPHVFILIQGQP